MVENKKGLNIVQRLMGHPIYTNFSRFSLHSILNMTVSKREISSNEYGTSEINLVTQNPLVFKTQNRVTYNLYQVLIHHTTCICIIFRRIYSNV